MKFDQRAFERLEAAMAYPSPNERDYDALVGALRDIADCVSIISCRQAERLYATVNPEKAQQIEKRPSGWKAAIAATRTINDLCAKYGKPPVFRGSYDWRRHNDELLEMLKAVIAFE